MNNIIYESYINDKSSLSDSLSVSYDSDESISSTESVSFDSSIRSSISSKSDNSDGYNSDDPNNSVESSEFNSDMYNNIPDFNNPIINSRVCGDFLSESDNRTFFGIGDLKISNCYIKKTFLVLSFSMLVLFLI